jgi:hypothetical protein
MTEEAESILGDIASLLEGGGEYRYVAIVRKALGSSQDQLNEFLRSNDLWGGSGSIADSCLLADREARSELEYLLIRLGRLQEQSGLLNVRTIMWVQAFEQWRAAGLRNI